MWKITHIIQKLRRVEIFSTYIVIISHVAYNDKYMCQNQVVISIDDKRIAYMAQNSKNKYPNIGTYFLLP